MAVSGEHIVPQIESALRFLIRNGILVHKVINKCDFPPDAADQVFELLCFKQLIKDVAELPSFKEVCAEVENREKCKEAA